MPVLDAFDDSPAVIKNTSNVIYLIENYMILVIILLTSIVYFGLQDTEELRWSSIK